ncbi:MAG: hypothetical protein WB816_14840 [Methylocystis sp.]
MEADLIVGPGAYLVDFRACNSLAPKHEQGEIHQRPPWEGDSRSVGSDAESLGEKSLDAINYDEPANNLGGWRRLKERHDSRVERECQPYRA